MLHVDGNRITDGQDIANHSMSLFSSLVSSNTSSSTILTVASNVPQLEEKYFGHSDQVIDDDIDIEETKSGGLDGLKVEHFKYGGEHLVAQEDIQLHPCSGRYTSVHEGRVGNRSLQKARGKSFTIKQLPRNYHLSRLVQDLRNNPSAATFSNPAWCWISSHATDCIPKGRLQECMDAIFATQEALFTHYRDGGKPYLCLFDLEKDLGTLQECLCRGTIPAYGTVVCWNASDTNIICWSAQHCWSYIDNKWQRKFSLWISTLVDIEGHWRASLTVFPEKCLAFLALEMFSETARDADRLYCHHTATDSERGIMWLPKIVTYSALDQLVALLAFECWDWGTMSWWNGW